MNISRVKTEKWHKHEEGDCASPLNLHGKHLSYFKKGFWKRYDCKKFLRNIKKMRD